MSTETGARSDLFAAASPIEDRLEIWLQFVHAGQPIDLPPHLHYRRLLSYLRDCAATWAFEAAPVETLERAWRTAGQLFYAYEPTSESERLSLLALEARMREAHRRATNPARAVNAQGVAGVAEGEVQVLGSPGPPAGAAQTTTTADPDNFVDPFVSVPDPGFRERVAEMLRSRRRHSSVVAVLPAELSMRHMPGSGVDPAANYGSRTTIVASDSGATTLPDVPRVDVPDPEAAGRMNDIRDALIMALGAYGAATGVTFWIRPGDRPGTVQWEVVLSGRPIGTITVAGPAPAPTENSGRLHNPEEGNRRALDL